MLDFEYFEQPKITSMNEMIVVVYTDAQTYTFASTNDLNSLLSLDEDNVPA